MTLEPPATDSTNESPFVLPAMADAYPLDPAERRSVDELLAELERERAGGNAGGMAVGADSN